MKQWKNLKNVKAVNKDMAEQLVSEAILDLEFVKNPKLNVTSLRLAPVKRFFERKEEMEER